MGRVNVGVYPFVLVVLTGFIGGAEPPAKPTYAPSETTVAILPVVNQAASTEEAKKEQAGEAADLLRSQFVGRKFQMVEDEKVQRIVADLRLDLNDSENRNKANYAKVAEALGARLVIATVILDLSSDYAYRSGRKQGHAKVEVKVFDAQRQEYVCVQVANETQKGDILFSDFQSAKKLRYGALAKALESALRDFLKPYPLLQKKPNKNGGTGKSSEG